MKIATRLAVWLLNTDIPAEDRSALTTAILDKSHAVPFRDIITYDDQGRLHVDGRAVDVDFARSLMESAKALLNNRARKYIREQVEFKAVNIGVHKSQTPLDTIFAKAAIWGFQQEEELIEQLAGATSANDDLQ